MRPDEHKKKKNAAYKKKHGIGQAKAEHGVDQSKQKKGHNKNAQRKENSDVLQTKGATVQKEEKEQKGSSSSESEVDEVKPPRKTYQRRQIVSNWQKYEIQPQNEEQETRGESYEKLLSMSSDAVAHFRFKDEEEWDTVGALADTKVNTDQFDQILNIDTQEIGQAMGCLPLYKVLGLPREGFPKAEVELMEKTAAEKRQIYLSEEPRPLLTSVLLKSLSDTKSCESELKNSVESSTIDEKSIKKDAAAHLKESSLHNKSHPKISSPADDGIPFEPSFSGARERLVLKDEDLDSLLHLDLPQAGVEAGASVTGQRNASEMLDSPYLTSTVSVPKEKNSILATSSQDPSLSRSKQEGETKIQKDGVDLEDWLDSILDD